MPNQNDPTQNPNPVNPPVDQPASQISPPVPPTIFPQSDLPPLPPAFQNMPETETISPTVGQSPVPATSSDSGSSAPPEISSVLPKAKKKFGGGRIIATILGLIVLVGGVGAGILLTQQPQLFQQKAKIVQCQSNSECPSNQHCSSGSCVANPVVQPPASTCSKAGNCVCSGNNNYRWASSNLTGTGVDPCKQVLDNSCINECKVAAPPAPPPACGALGSACASNANCCSNYCSQSTGSCTTVPPPPPPPPTDDPKCSGIVNGSTTLGVGSLYPICYVNHYWCQTKKPGGCSDQLIGNAIQSASFTKNCGTEQIDLYCPLCPNYIKGQSNTLNGQLFRSKVYPNDCSTSTTTSTTTSTLVAPSCLAVNMYSSAWGAIPVAERSSLTAGTSINFCVAGTTSSGTFDKARFTINGTTLAETTAVRPGSTDFCQIYEIPAGVTTFNVSAQIHHATEGWF